MKFVFGIVVLALTTWQTLSAAAAPDGSRLHVQGQGSGIRRLRRFGNDIPLLSTTGEQAFSEQGQSTPSWMIVPNLCQYFQHRFPWLYYTVSNLDPQRQNSTIQELLHFLDSDRRFYESYCSCASVPSRHTDDEDSGTNPSAIFTNCFAKAYNAPKNRKTPQS